MAHTEITAYLDHMWRFLALPGGGVGFGEWETGAPSLVAVGLGDDYPTGFDSFLAMREVSKPEFRLVLACTTEMLYGSLYGAAEELDSWRYFCELWGLAAPLGVLFPDIRPFMASRWSDRHGWGLRPTAEELSAWREGADS